MNNEPVAWMEIEEGGITEYKVWREPVSSKSIPLYTHPVKELTDEEIDKLLHEEFVKFQATGLISEIEWERWLVKAILRKDGA